MDFCSVKLLLLIMLGFAVLTGLLIYWHIDPDTYKDIIFIAAYRTYGLETFLDHALMYSFMETWATADSLGEEPFAWAQIKRFSLYVIYLQLTALLWCFLLVFKEIRNIITSVKLRQSFRIENYRSFRKIGKYLFSIFCLSGFCFIAAEYGNFYGLYLHLTPLFFMMGAYIMAEIFKEGHVLQEEVQNTI